MMLALRKRPVSIEQIDSARASASRRSCSTSGAREVPSHAARRTGDARAEELDKVAYVRFASVYRSFEDVDEFKTLVDEVRR